MRPSKKITRQPWDAHQADKACLLARSDLSARYFALCLVIQAFFADVLLFWFGFSSFMSIIQKPARLIVA